MSDTSTTRAGFEIIVNGSPRTAAPGATVASFLADHDIDAAVVVVEANGEILTHDRFASTPLEAGDSLEVVHFVGGG